MKQEGIIYIYIVLYIYKGLLIRPLYEPFPVDGQSLFTAQATRLLLKHAKAGIPSSGRSETFGG